MTNLHHSSVSVLISQTIRNLGRLNCDTWAFDANNSTCITLHLVISLRRMVRAAQHRCLATALPHLEKSVRMITSTQQLPVDTRKESKTYLVVEAGEDERSKRTDTKLAVRVVEKRHAVVFADHFA